MKIIFCSPSMFVEENGSFNKPFVVTCYDDNFFFFSECLIVTVNDMQKKCKKIIKLLSPFFMSSAMSLSYYVAHNSSNYLVIHATHIRGNDGENFRAKMFRWTYFHISQLDLFNKKKCKNYNNKNKLNWSEELCIVICMSWTFVFYFFCFVLVLLWLITINKNMIFLLLL